MPRPGRGRSRSGPPPRWDGGHPAGAGINTPGKESPPGRRADQSRARSGQVSIWIATTARRREPGRRRHQCPGQLTPDGYQQQAEGLTRPRPGQAGLDLDRHHGADACTAGAGINAPGKASPPGRRVDRAKAMSGQVSIWSTTTVGRWAPGRRCAWPAHAGQSPAAGRRADHAKARPGRVSIWIATTARRREPGRCRHQCPGQGIATRLKG
jgi:hypothetical protein